MSVTTAASLALAVGTTTPSIFSLRARIARLITPFTGRSRPSSASSPAKSSRGRMKGTLARKDGSEELPLTVEPLPPAELSPVGEAPVGEGRPSKLKGTLVSHRDEEKH